MVTATDVLFATRVAYGLEDDMWGDPKTVKFIPHELVCEARQVAGEIMYRRLGLTGQSTSRWLGIHDKGYLCESRKSAYRRAPEGMADTIYRMASDLAAGFPMPHAGRHQHARPSLVREAACAATGADHDETFLGMSKTPVAKAARHAAACVMVEDGRMSLQHAAKHLGFNSHASVHRILKIRRPDPVLVELVAADAIKRTRASIGTGFRWAWPPVPAWSLIASSRRLAGRRAESAA